MGLSSYTLNLYLQWLFLRSALLSGAMVQLAKSDARKMLVLVWTPDLQWHERSLWAWLHCAPQDGVPRPSAATVDQVSSWGTAPSCVQLLLRAVSQTEADTQTHVHILGSVTMGTHLPALQRWNADCNKYTKVSEAGNLLFSGFLLAGFPEPKL